MQISDVLPQVISATYGCPKCKAVIKLEQIDRKLREPIKCKCGYEESFKILSKTFIDVQRIIVKELEEDLDADDKKHYARRIKVFLKEDLCSPSKQKIIKPSVNVVVKGKLLEKPVPLDDGSISTRFDVCVEASSIEKLKW